MTQATFDSNAESSPGEQIFVSAKTAAQSLGVTVRTIHRWVSIGQFVPAYRRHGTVRYDLNEIIAWMRSEPDRLEQLKADDVN